MLVSSCNYVSLGGICWKQYSNFIFTSENSLCETIRFYCHILDSDDLL